MALTRKMLKGMGISEEQADTIIEAHTETVDGLKEKLKTAQEKADSLDGVQKELNELKANNGENWKEKYTKEHEAFEQYKTDQTAKETKAAKESAAKAYFESKNIKGANLTIAMRGARDEISALDIDSDGNIKDASTLDSLVKGEFSGLVVKTTTKGPTTPTPPANTGGETLTRADLYKKDDKGRYIMSTAERQKALAENPSLLK